MDAALYKIGYDLEPSKYSPSLGYSRLRAIISSRPTERFFDVKALNVPTFDGRFYHKTQLTRHELLSEQTFQACLGQFSLETYRGESLRFFSFGGLLKATIEDDDLYCEITSNAPIFKLQDDPGAVGEVIIDELLDFLAIKEAKLISHEDELYSRLARYDPYQVFLASLITLQDRADDISPNMRRGNYHKVVTELHKIIKIIQDNDGWDGRAPSLDDLISGNANKR